MKQQQEKVKQMQIEGRQCPPFFYRPDSSDLNVYQQVFRNQDYKLSLPSPPKVIIDAGANIGLSAIYFAQAYPEAQIYALEPEGSNYAMLHVNTTPYPNIHSFNLALWHTNETIYLNDPGRGKWGFQTDAAPLDTSSYAVQAKSMDQLMKDFQLDYIDILKMDIEGAEKEVFEAPSAWLDKVGILIVELHDHFKIGCRRNFYNATNAFKTEWIRGENVFLSDYSNNNSRGSSNRAMT